MGKEAWVQPIVDTRLGTYSFEVRVGTPNKQDFDPGKGNINRRGGTCILSGAPIPFDFIRKRSTAGDMGMRLMAIVAEGNRGRVYLPPQDKHERCANDVVVTDCPETDLPDEALGFRVQNYGLKKHRQLFSTRQLKSLVTLSDLVEVARKQLVNDASALSLPPDQVQEYADAVALYLAFTVDKLADLANRGCPWEPGAQCPRRLFGRQTLPMHWNFAEGNPFGSSSGSFDVLVELCHSNLNTVFADLIPSPIGSAFQRDAALPIVHPASPMVCTDPPYYDNIGYADLSDFFYIWLRRAIGARFPELFTTVLTPKNEEIIAAPHRFSGSKAEACDFFEKRLGNVFDSINAAHDGDVPFTVFYAFRQTESEDEDTPGDEDDDVTESLVSTGWETMLQGLNTAGFAVVGTWPVRTEGKTRLRGLDSNALASSIVLVCRPRSLNATLATRKEFISTLRRELPDALRNLQRGNIAPVDLAQSAIGPGMGVFTRFAKVLESDGSLMTVRTALGLINQTLDEVLAEQEGEFDGDTRWALSWFEQFGMEDGPFGDAETLSKAKNTAINGLVDAGIVAARGGKVRLVRRDELPGDWNPATDNRLTVWEVTQHLIHRLDQQGETGAATLVGQLGSVAEVARDLAYRLYSTCERKKWAQDALAYNSLVVAWPELTKLALSQRNQQPQRQQQEMF